MPGGPRTVAGITGVGVWPTHRRRGVLSALMRRQLADIHGRGEPLAAMWASEGAIYGRFGYGPAAHELSAWIRGPYATLGADAHGDPDLTLELLPSEQAREVLAQVHRAATVHRLGRFQRGDSWWGRRLGSGATYLGQRSPTALVDAGAVHEHTPGAAAGLGIALHQPRAAFCGMVF